MITTDEKVIDELLTRGVEEVIPKDELKRELLSGRQLRVKLGIDPTSPHIHIGRAVQLLKLRDFQKLGHQIVLIIGDTTGVIGDTSDKTSERPMLEEEQVKRNAQSYFDQVGRVLDMEHVETHYNSEWLNKLTYGEIGEQADCFSVADFIARENIRRRLDEGTRVSLREVIYPLMQGYDSVAIKADVELGGTDQRFNLLAGRTLQERYGQKPQSIMMTTLMEGLDGRKMSSSWGNTVNLTDAPNDMFGKVMSLHDALVERYFVTSTRVPLSEIEGIMELHPRDAKMRLASEIVKLYHSEGDAQRAQEHFIATFSEGNVPADVKTVTAARGASLADVLLEAEIVASKTEFRRLAEDGAITDAESGERLTNPAALLEGPVTLKVGKRRFLKVEIS